MQTFVFLTLALSLCSIFICHAIAKSRGAKPVFWGTMGLIFGPLAIPFAFFAKPVSADSMSKKSTDEAEKK